MDGFTKPGLASSGVAASMGSPVTVFWKSTTVSLVVVVVAISRSYVFVFGI